MFKVGDRLKCINALNFLHIFQFDKIYTVVSTYSAFVCLKEVSGYWSKTRFVLHNPCEDILQNIIDN